MKKLAIFIIIILLIPNVALSGRKRGEKSGKLKNSLYTDHKYNFKITIPDGWKSKTYKANSQARLALMQNDFKWYKKQTARWATNFLNRKEYSNAPLVNIWIVETEKTYSDFLNSLLANDHASKFKDNLIKFIRPIWDEAFFERFVTKSKKKLKFDGHKALSWHGSYLYTFTLVENKLDVTYGGAIYAIENDKGSILLITIRTEKEFIDEILEELQPMLSSLSW